MFGLIHSPAPSCRLKTGWSVKTGSMGFQSSLPPLGADEQAAILDVIRRAEQLDHLEQERVSIFTHSVRGIRAKEGEGGVYVEIYDGRFLKGNWVKSTPSLSGLITENMNAGLIQKHNGAQ